MYIKIKETLICVEEIAYVTIENVYELCIGLKASKREIILTLNTCQERDKIYRALVDFLSKTKDVYTIK